jgi:ribosomal RNA-processing protein 9
LDHEKCHWITALHALPYSNLFASGSGDGYIRIWKLSEEKRSFVLKTTIPVDGIVNELHFFAREGNVQLVAAIGREQRSGRWFKVKCKNRIQVFDLGPLE